MTDNLILSWLWQSDGTNAGRVDRSVAEGVLALVGWRLSDLRIRRGNHVAAFLVIVEREARAEESGRRLGSCRVADDAGQDDVAAVES
jgi:hypothetical protein